LILNVRPLRAGDADIVAQIHAASWRDAYRGMLSDTYLDGDLVGERRAVWHSRLQGPQLGLLALHESKPVGFAFVLPGHRGAGVGTRLLHELSGQAPRGGIHLWVYAQNARARAYYERLGAQELEQEAADTPDGGKVLACLYAWPDVAVLHRLARPKA
jgi:GNAT superfamily N-acetyltransferase